MLVLPRPPNHYLYSKLYKPGSDKYNYFNIHNLERDRPPLVPFTVKDSSHYLKHHFATILPLDSRFIFVIGGSNKY